MIHFTAEVLGDRILDRAFNRIDGYISDFRNIWPAITKRFYEIEQEQFDTEGARGRAGRWKPLTPAYKRWKEVHFPGEPILQREHDLFESMTSPDAPDSIYRPDKTELTIGTKVPYAKHHQKTRPIISLIERDKRDMQKDIQAELVRFVRAVGFEVEEKAA